MQPCRAGVATAEDGLLVVGALLVQQLLGLLGHRLQAPHLGQRTAHGALVELEELDVEVQAEHLVLLVGELVGLGVRESRKRVRTKTAVFP